MKRILLLVGGVVQVLFAAMHSAMFYGIASSNMPQAIKQTAYLFNGCVLTMVIFFAYVSLLRRKDLIGTPLGRWTCGFISVLYLQRGVVEVIMRGLDPGFFALFMGLTALYGVVALAPERAQPAEGVSASVDSVASIR